MKIADILRTIFYASSRKKALECYDEFVKNYKEELPSAVKCLGTSIHECLSFQSFPEEEWLSLRTTNCIERVNKEFKRRTKPMEIMAGEKSAYRLLCFIAFKMEMNWKVAPLHKKSGLPTLQEFTQLI
jgi:transposase-like protein